jgi:hypothetical protein
VGYLENLGDTKINNMTTNPKNTGPGPLQWEVYGRCYDASMDNEYCEDSITLPEQISNLHMGQKPPKIQRRTSTTADDFGKPIDANLAVHLIKRSYGAVNEILDNVDLLKSLTHSEKDLSKDEKDKIKQEMLNMMYGVTFDKTVILKILSQPNCEGIRSYFCKRKDGHLSIALIGVDGCGFDLNYDPNAPKVVAKTAGPPPNNSLIIEYGYPPSGPGIVDQEMENGKTKFDSHYVLLNYINTIDP